MTVPRSPAQRRRAPFLSALPVLLGESNHLRRRGANAAAPLVANPKCRSHPRGLLPELELLGVRRVNPDCHGEGCSRAAAIAADRGTGTLVTVVLPKRCSTRAVRAR